MCNNEFLNEWKKQMDENGLGEENESKEYEDLGANILAIAITILVVAAVALGFALSILSKVIPKV